MNRLLLRELQDRRCYPSVSILVNLSPGATPNAAEIASLQNYAAEADRRLAGDVPDRIREHVRASLDELINEVITTEARRAVAICVSPERAIAVELGQPVQERLIIDETFATRDLVADLHRTIAFRVITMSEHRVRLFSGDRDRLVEHRTDGWPMNAPEDTSTLVWQRSVDQALEHLHRDSPLPTVVAGVGTTLRARLQQAMVHSVGMISGNHDRTPREELHERAWPLIEQWLDREHAASVDLLDAARSARRYAGGVNEVWPLAQEGRIDTLIVEQTLQVAVRIDQHGQLQDAQDTTHPDVVDDIVDETIEAVLQRGGNVVIVPDGTLAAHDRISAIVRY